MLQHTPLAVTVASPLLVTFPPQVAVLDVMPLTVEVVTVGNDTLLHTKRTDHPMYLGLLVTEESCSVEKHTIHTLNSVAYELE